MELRFWAKAHVLANETKARIAIPNERRIHLFLLMERDGKVILT